MQVPTHTGTLLRTRVARRNVGRTITIILFLLPALVLFTVFVVYPVFQAAYYSVWKWNGLGPLKNFIGINNYISILNDKVFATKRFIIN